MEYRRIERRAFKRLKIPGTTVSYKQGKYFFSKKKYVEELYPVVEISRGGIRFLGQKLFTTNSKISLKILIPEVDLPLILKGRVRWASSNPPMRYKYQIGVQFNPFGIEKRYNRPEILDKIISLEQKFLTDNKSDTH